MKKRREMEFYRFDKDGNMLDKPLRVYYKFDVCMTPENEAKVIADDLGMNFKKYSGMTNNEPWKSMRKNKEMAQYFGSWEKVEQPKPKDENGNEIKKKRGREAEFSDEQISEIHNEMKEKGVSLTKILKEKEMPDKYPKIYNQMKRMGLIQAKPRKKS